MVLFTIIVFVTSFFLPVASIVLMRSLGIVESIEMEERKQRIGPLLAVGVFYLWMFISIKDNPAIGDLFKIACLGTCISLGFLFFLTIFTKISLHASAVGGTLAFVFLSIFKLQKTEWYFNLTEYVRHSKFAEAEVDLEWFVATKYILIAMMLITGLVCTARLQLQAHKPDEIFGGLLIGATSMWLGFTILL